MNDITARLDRAMPGRAAPHVCAPTPPLPEDQGAPAPDRADAIWLEESPLEPAGQRLRVRRTIHRAPSRYQDIWIFENEAFGRVLALDGLVQVSEQDEFIYHEMMAHVPMFAHGGARHVLIVGGGDGGVLREVLKHASVQRAVMVEIDREVIDLCRAHLPSVSAGAFSDPRAEVIVADGLEFLRRTQDTFDVILVDAPDPVGSGRTLFSTAFLAACRARLRPGGILVAQGGVGFLQAKQIRRTAFRLRELLGDVAAYTASVPSYYGGAMVFVWAAETAHKRLVPEDMLAARFAGAGVKTRCYTPALHAAAFVLPRHLAEMLRLESSLRHRPPGLAELARRF